MIFGCEVDVDRMRILAWRFVRSGENWCVQVIVAEVLAVFKVVLVTLQGISFDVGTNLHMSRTQHLR